MTTTGTRTLSTGAKLVIWEREDGYYWLIDEEEGGERSEDVGPFETIHEAEEDAQAWFAARHAEEDPFLGGENPLDSE